MFIEKLSSFISKTLFLPKFAISKTLLKKSEPIVEIFTLRFRNY